VTPKTLIVSTCGTSALTYRASQATRDLLNRTANLRVEQVDPADRAAIDRRAAEQEAALQACSIDAARDAIDRRQATHPATESAMYTSWSAAVIARPLYR